MTHPVSNVISPRLRAHDRFGLALLFVLAVPIALAALRYLIPSMPGAPVEVTSNAFALPTLPIHAGFGALALLIGPLQFLPGFRRRHTRVHRLIGLTYVSACLISGFAGYVLAFGSTSGIGATLGFSLMATAWIFSTAKGLLTAFQSDFTAHRRWMIRSVALTFTAFTLRVLLPLQGPLGLDFVTWFVATSFLCWVPNLIFAELYLRLTGFAPQNQPSSRSFA